jgi:ATP-binding cassette subfamily C exporter for protease/lipase
VGFASTTPSTPASVEGVSHDLAADINRYWRSLRTPLLASSWLAGALALAPSLYMLEVYGRVVNARSTTTLWMLSMAVVGAFVLLEGLEWLRNRMLQRSAQSFDALWAARLFGCSLKAQASTAAPAWSQLMGDWRTSQRFVTSAAFHGLIDAPIALLFLGVVFLISPLLGVFALVGAALQVGIALLAESKTHVILKDANRKAATAAQWADDSVRNAQVLASMGMAERLQARWLKIQGEAVQRQAEASERAGTSAALSRGLQNIVTSGLLGLGCWLLLGNSLHGGPVMMIVASILGGRVMAPLLQVVTQWSAVVNAQLAWQRLQKVLSDLPVVQPALPLPRPKGTLAVEGVVAGIPGQRRAQPVLAGVGFQLRPGDVLAVVGPSAAGKSTLCRLLVGQWPAQQGSVRLDGYDVFSWNKDEVGPHLGYLSQDVTLLPGTVADNICRYSGAPHADVEACAKQVGLHEAILLLPQGYATWIDDATLLFSGGQRQRLALACALFGRPALVVLDEPNSSLDDEGDAMLAHAIQQLSAQGTTFVVITHRTRILEIASHMMVLVGGRVQSFGPRNEVLQAMASSAPAKSVAGVGAA